MNAIKELLNRRWILKREEPELYFSLKDQSKMFGDFFKDKLGYALIINPLLIKLEKLPGKTKPWMGIRTFETPQAYLFLCYILMFLEDREPEEQFILSQITDYIKAQPMQDEPVDWTVYQQRKALIKVLEFTKSEGLILVSDGNDSDFISSQGAVEVLYENTGASKYFVRRFPFDITQVNTPKEFERVDWQSEDADRGILRRHRVYRRLILEPVIYQQGSDDQDYLYIKNQRSVIAHDFDAYLGADLQVHKNGAMLIFPEGQLVTDSIPNRKNSSDIVLQICFEVRKAVEEGSFIRQESDKIPLSRVKWDAFIEQVRETYSEGWSKGYREMSLSHLKAELNDIMSQFGMIEMNAMHKEIILLPAVAKMIGEYPKAYWEQTTLMEDI